MYNVSPTAENIEESNPAKIETNQWDLMGHLVCVILTVSSIRF